MDMIDKSLRALRLELPKWEVVVLGLDNPKDDVTWIARDPSFEQNGLSVSAPDPIELLARVRAVVLAFDYGRRYAEAREKWEEQQAAQPSFRSRKKIESDVPIQARAARTPTNPPPEPVRNQGGALDPTALGPPKLASSSSSSQLQNYTGEACQDCQQFAMVRTGKCTTCLNCGSTSGGCS